MTVLVDTSAWVEFLRATSSAQDAAVTSALERGTAATTDAVLLELLVGATDEQRVRQLRGLLAGCIQLPQEPLGDVERAAALFRACRRGGETPRSLLDCLVAAVALRNDVPVLHRDRDFEVLARHTEIRSTTG